MKRREQSIKVLLRTKEAKYSKRRLELSTAGPMEWWGEAHMTNRVTSF